MTLIQIISLLVVVAALMSFANYHLIKLPTSIGVMLIALLLSGSLIIAGKMGLPIHARAKGILQSIEFTEALLQGMLSLLLFAGALHVDVGELKQRKWPVLLLATCGVVISALIFSGIVYGLLAMLGLKIDYIYCLLFGAIVSPTDPVAVLAILKKAGAPKSIEATVSGEALFNDGVGIVAFAALFGIIFRHESASASHILLLVGREAVGGVLFGLALGWVTYLMLRSVDDYQVEILLTIGLVLGGYALVSALHSSAPLAIAVAGLLIAHRGRKFAMSEKTRERLDTFWELVDEILNAVLFLLIGLEVLVLDFSRGILIAAAVGIIGLLFARFLSISIPLTTLRQLQTLPKGALAILTWGGLRGGISVAMALTLPAGAERDIILGMTYVIVVFAIVVQGTTIGPLTSRLFRTSPRELKAEAA